MIPFFNMGFIVCYAITIVYRRESKSMSRKMLSRYVTCQYKSLQTILLNREKKLLILWISYNENIVFQMKNWFRKPMYT